MFFKTPDGLVYKHFKALKKNNSLKVVFCHGFNVTSEYFDLIGRRISYDYDYYAIELEGMGITEYKPGSKLCLEFYAEQLRKLIVEDLDLDQVILIGHSMGGGIVSLVSSLIPERIKLLIMVSPMNSSLSLQVINTPKLYPKTYREAVTTAKIVYKYPWKLFPDKENDFNLRRIQDQQLKIRQYSKQLYRRLSTFSNLFVLMKAEKRISVPTLLIMAKDDKIIKASIAINYLEKRNKNITPYLIHDSGHCPFLEQEEEFYTILIKAINLIQENKDLKILRKV